MTRVTTESGLFVVLLIHHGFLLAALVSFTFSGEMERNRRKQTGEGGKKKKKNPESFMSAGE